MRVVTPHLPLASDEVAVWYRTTELLDPSELHAMARVLSDDERTRVDRFAFTRDRRDFTAAHALLRYALSRHGGRPEAEWQFETNRHGKPSVVAEQSGTPPLVFNLSHTKGFVACAVARGTRVGIDVERVRLRVDARELAARYFAPSETRTLDTADPHDYQARFTELWTLKEAYIKALGVGLTLPLDSIAFAFEGEAGLRFIGPEDRAVWQFLLAVPSADVRMALAVHRGSPECRWRLNLHPASAPTADSKPLQIVATG